jgi:hypothetical protein
MNTNFTHIRHPLVLAAVLALPLTFAVGCDDDAEPVVTPPAVTDDHADHEGQDEADHSDHGDHDEDEHGDAAPLPTHFNTPTAPRTPRTVLARSDR